MLSVSASRDGVYIKEYAVINNVVELPKEKEEEELCSYITVNSTTWLVLSSR